MHERRQQPPPADLNGYLRQLPALVLLDRLPSPMLGVGRLGDVAYANPACVELLGYDDVETLTRLTLPQLLADHRDLDPVGCLEQLRNADGIVGWTHCQEYVIRTMVSPPLLVRESDPLLLVSITDVTDWLWESKPVTSVRNEIGSSP